MQYAVLGKTGHRVSRLGFGAMRLPMKAEVIDRDKAVAMIHRAIELGVNYIDTAAGYNDGDSERVVGEAIRGLRDRLVISTKNHHYNRRDDRPWWANLEGSLRRLGLEYIDVYHCHFLGWKSYQEHLIGKGGQLEWLHKAHGQGLIRHLAYSCHDQPDKLLDLARTGEFEVVTLQHNLIDRGREHILPDLRRLGLGIVVMGPVGGGRLGSPSKAINRILPGAASVPEIALRFVLANPNVTVALSGMSAMGHVEENARVASRRTPLTAAEKRRVTVAMNRYKKLADLYCTGCNYCMPCPHGVNIPTNFFNLNYARVYDLTGPAKQRYQHLPGKASMCVACGACRGKCPQNIDIIAQLRQTVRTLDDAYGKTPVTIEPLEVRRAGRRGRRFPATIRCRLTAHNLSDRDVLPALAIGHGQGLKLQLTSRPKRMGPFERARAKFTVQCADVSGEGQIDLVPELGGSSGTVYSRGPLRVAVAPRVPRRSGRRSPAQCPPVRAAEPVGPPETAARARRDLSLVARFSHDPEALLIHFDIRTRTKLSGRARGPVREGDHVRVFLGLADQPGIRRGEKTPRTLDLVFSLQPGEARADGVRWGLSPEHLAMVRPEARGTATARTLAVRIPWKAMELPPPRLPARLGLNFRLVRPRRAGQVPLQLAWTADRSAWLLLAR